MVSKEEREAMERASRDSAEKARELLDADLAAAMAHVGEIDALKPRGADEELYRRLVDTIQDASRHNLSVAQLRKNVESLGRGAVGLLNQLAARLR